MAIITVQHMSYEVQLQLQRTLLFHPLAVEEDSLLNSKPVLAENRRVSDFHLTFYKRFDDSHLRDDQKIS
ncbi:hypothetical protein TNCV_4607171 [Trichonephila clavipes]|nr:hypothetical protein TNCV_4607171 [Trichonephila clavipes]